MSGIVLDIGTGDGDFVYKLAKDNPDKLIIGLDSNHSALIKQSLKINKNVSRGGLRNALFVLGTAEDIPEEFQGKVNQVFINFPWGKLLHDVVMVDYNLWKGIYKSTQKDSIIEVIFGYDKNYDTKELKRLELKELSIEYIKQSMLPALKRFNFNKVELTEINTTKLRHYPTSWSKRLSFGKQRQYYYLKLQRL